MTQRVIRFIAAALLLLGLAACRDSKPIQGWVVGKAHIRQHTAVTYSPVLHQTQTNITPEQWVVFVADSVTVHKCHVDRATFERLTKGEFVTQKGIYYGKKESD